jgi:ADP-heptose:LPS heptosyltransferase
VLKQIKQVFSFYRDEYRKHLFKSRVSYLINYFGLLFSSYLNRNRKLVAISLIEHIGDIIANEPISREIRKKHPSSTIIWLVRKPFKELIKYNPNIDKVLTVYCLTTWIRIHEKIKFEAVYDLHFNGRSCNICHVPLIKENVNDSINSTNYFNYGGLLKSVCLHNRIELSDTRPRMYIPVKIINKSKSLVPNDNYVVVHCCSNEIIKDWDNDKWNQLVRKIIDDFKYYIIEIGTHCIINNESKLYLNLCSKLSILQSAAVIKKAKLFIGIDSGPAHMANAVDTPGIVLLGEYFFGMKNFNPYSGNYGSLENCRIIHSSGKVKSISVDSVLKNMEELLKLSSLGI